MTQGNLPVPTPLGEPMSKFQEETIAIERFKARATPFSLFASVLAAGITASVAYRSAQNTQAQVDKVSAESQERAAAAAFELKVAEMVMSGGKDKQTLLDCEGGV